MKSTIAIIPILSILFDNSIIITTEAWLSSSFSSTSLPKTKDLFMFQERLGLKRERFNSHTLEMVSNTNNGSLHGVNSCFLPLQQFEEDYYSPRICQIAGMYPGVTLSEFNAVTSEPSAEPGQWTYDFSDPDGPQMGTVALQGSNIVSVCVDPVVLIADHRSLNVSLPDEIEGGVDLLVLADRSKKTFIERKFLVLSKDGGELVIGAFGSKEEVPANLEIVGQVDYVQVPWLPSMQRKKTGFEECD